MQIHAVVETGGKQNEVRVVRKKRIRQAEDRGKNPLPEKRNPES